MIISRNVMAALPLRFGFVRLALGALLLALFAVPAQAFNDECENAWFSRNKIMADAGYCFGSTLGKATFGNANCTGKNVNLTATQKADVAALQAMEKAWECSVNTSKTILRSEMVPLLRSLDRQPIRDDFESACLGWLEGELALYAGPDSRRVVGSIQRGNDVNYSHLWASDAMGADYSFVMVRTGSASSSDLISAGWVQESKVTSPNCRAFAG